MSRNRRRRTGRCLPLRWGSLPSRILRPFPDQALAPARAQDVAALGIFLVEIIRVHDAVGAKTAEILAQLAPGREQPHRFEIADRDRPDGALGVAAVLVAIMQRDLLALMNLRARLYHVDAVGLAIPDRPGAAGGLQHEGPQALRHGVRDLGN